MVSLAQDRRAFCAPISVYLRLATEFLEFDGSRPLKIAGVATAMGRAPRTVEAFVRGDYLERRQSEGLVEYRMRWNRAICNGGTS